jgi:hypothetical protein
VIVQRTLPFGRQTTTPGMTGIDVKPVSIRTEITIPRFETCTNTAREDFAVPEDEVLAIVAKYEKTVIIDFDETLYLRNSTADFIDCAVPGILALIVLKVLDLLAPWRWTGGLKARDVWRVRIVLALFPWTLRRWKRRCREQNNALTNLPLLRVLRQRGRPFIIATSGFSIVVDPLVSEMGCADVPVIACRLNQSSDRTAGKLALIENRIGSALAEAMVVTDSTDDIDILRRCARPCLTQWKNARYQRSFRRAYLPGIYTLTVKRPDGTGLGGIAATFSFWLLASMTAPEVEISSIVAIFFLFLSLWSVYEVGYMDNDICALKFETDPVFTREAIDFPYPSVQRSAWAFAIILGGAGCWFAQSHSWPTTFAKWLMILIFTRGVFHYYNRIDKKTRVWLYPILQIAREASFILVVPVGVVGVIICMAQIIGKWLQYYIYRYIRAFNLARWPEIELHTVRLCLFMALVGSLLVVEQRASVWAWSTAAILGWCGFLARKEIAAIIRGAHRIDAEAGDVSLFGVTPTNGVEGGGR